MTLVLRSLLVYYFGRIMLKTRGSPKNNCRRRSKVQSGTGFPEVERRKFEKYRLSATQSQSDTDAATSTLPKTARPSFYKVILLNDDFTPMDFVVLILRKFFGKNDGDAQQVMLQVHQEGAGIAGVYTFELAETKTYLVNEYSRQHKYPLKCVMEKDTAESQTD